MHVKVQPRYYFDTPHPIHYVTRANEIKLVIVFLEYSGPEK